MGKGTLVLVACALLTPAALPQDKSNVNAVGTWKLNLQESTMTTKPKSMTLRVTADSPTAIRYSLSGVDANGKAVHFKYDGAPDGKPHPFTVSETYSTAAYNRDNPTTAHATLATKDGRTVTQEITLSDDGKMMTIKASSGDKSWTEVYDRVGAGQKKAAAKTY